MVVTLETKGKTLTLVLAVVACFVNCDGGEGDLEEPSVDRQPVRREQKGTAESGRSSPLRTRPIRSKARQERRDTAPPAPLSSELRRASDRAIEALAKRPTVSGEKAREFLDEILAVSTSQARSLAERDRRKELDKRLRTAREAVVSLMRGATH